jgi:hypothetical protein
MTTLGTATPMDRQETCVEIDDKTGHLIGVPCGHWHEEHVCLFDMTTTQRLCAAYPKCKRRLKRRPQANIPGRLYIYYDLVVVRWGIYE